MTVFERIESLRNKAGISQGKLEKELGFSNGSISKWKNSIPNPERLKKLSDYFNVTVEYLMTGNEPELSKYSAKNAELLNRILDDVDLKDALEKYFELSDVKKKLIIDTINILWD